MSADAAMAAGPTPDTHLTALCRDCGRANPTAARCPDCGSPRIVRHEELGQLSIAHVDCDAFYATVEKRDDPSLRDRPVIVGGTGSRGVVSAACYMARAYGVHSAMPMFKARGACPDAVVIRPDMAKYSAVGREVRAAMQELTPLVEPLSIDEAFLDLSGTERLHRRTPAESLALLARNVERDIGITISVGLSFNKFLAKIASDLNKPRGYAVIGRREAVDFLAKQPVGLIWGVGKALQKRLAGDGIRTIAQLQSREKADLMARYGSMGGRLYHLARAEDNRRVNPVREAKSISSETTFSGDISDPEELARILWRQAERVAGRLKRTGLAGVNVTLKLKETNFRIRTRSRTLGEPTRLAERIYLAALPLLEREADGTAYRLLGVGISEFTSAEEADRGDLLDRDLERQKLTESALDAVRARFGDKSVIKGRALSRNRGKKAKRD